MRRAILNILFLLLHQSCFGFNTDNFIEHLVDAIETQDKLNEHHKALGEYEKLNFIIHLDLNLLLDDDPRIFKVLGNNATDVTEDFPETKKLSDIFNSVQNQVSFYNVVLGGIPNYFKIIKDPSTYHYGDKQSTIYSKTPNGYYSVGDYGAQSGDLLAHLQEALNTVSSTAQVGSNTVFNFYSYTESAGAKINFVHTAFEGQLFSPHLTNLNLEMQSVLNEVNANGFANAGSNLDLKLKYHLNASLKTLQKVNTTSGTMWDEIFAADAMNDLSNFSTAPWNWQYFNSPEHQQAAQILKDFLSDCGFEDVHAGTVGNLSTVTATQEMEGDSKMEYLIELHDGLGKEGLKEILMEWGVGLKDHYAYYCFTFDHLTPGFLGWFSWYDTYCLDTPPLVVELIARVIVAPFSAVYGYWTGTDMFSGKELTGLDYFLNIFDLIPGAALFTKPAKLGIKGIKFIKGSNVYLNSIDVISKISNSCAKLLPEIASLGSKGLVLLKSAGNQLVIAAKNAGGQVVNIIEIAADNTIKVLRELLPGLKPDQVLLDLGPVNMKVGDDIVERQLKIVKTGDGQVYVQVAKSLSDKLSDFPQLLTWFNNGMPEEVITKLDNWTPTHLGKLENDFANGLENTFKLQPELLDAWKVAINNPLIRKDITTLNSIDKIITNPNIQNVISQSDLSSIINKLAQKGVKCRTCQGGNSNYKFLDEILDDIEFGALKYTDAYIPVLTGFKQGGNFTEGAMFVASSVKKYPSEFPVGTIFEFTEVTVGGVRRVDVKVTSTFYEFKSVASGGMPPGGFADQFIKDLQLAEVNNLNQIKWWFDGTKVNNLNKIEFLNSLNQKVISQEVINKFVQNGPKTQQSLINLIDANFDLIFHIK